MQDRSFTSRPGPILCRVFHCKVTADTITGWWGFSASSIESVYGLCITLAVIGRLEAEPRNSSILMFADALESGRGCVHRIRLRHNRDSKRPKVKDGCGSIPEVMVAEDGEIAGDKVVSAITGSRKP